MPAPSAVCSATRSTVRSAVCSAVLVVIVVSVGVIVVAPTAGWAHANLLAAAPAPGQVAGGTVDRIQLVFDEPVDTFEASIAGPDSEPLTVETERVGPQQLDLRFDPLELEGAYLVRYRFVSVDRDLVESGFGFEYDRDAPGVLPLSGPSIVVSSSSGPSRLAWSGIGVAAVVVASAAVVLFRRRRLLIELRSGPR